MKDALKVGQYTGSNCWCVISSGTVEFFHALKVQECLWSSVSRWLSLGCIEWLTKWMRKVHRCWSTHQGTGVFSLSNVKVVVVSMFSCLITSMNDPWKCSGVFEPYANNLTDEGTSCRGAVVVLQLRWYSREKVALSRMLAMTLESTINCTGVSPISTDELYFVFHNEQILAVGKVVIVY